MEILAVIVVVLIVAAAMKAAKPEKPKPSLLLVPIKPKEPQGCGLLIVALLAGLVVACGVALAF